MSITGAPVTAGNVLDEDVTRVVKLLLQVRMREERLNRMVDAWEKKIDEIWHQSPCYYA